MRNTDASLFSEGQEDTGTSRVGRGLVILIKPVVHFSLQSRRQEEPYFILSKEYG
jgi:hypothetical protein